MKTLEDDKERLEQEKQDAIQISAGMVAKKNIEVRVVSRWMPRARGVDLGLDLGRVCFRVWYDCSQNTDP